MEKLTLIRPNLSFSEEIRAYRQEFLDVGGPLNGCGPLADPTRRFLERSRFVTHSLHFWKLTADISAIPSAQVNGRKDMQQRCSMTVFHTAAVSALTVCWFAVWIPIPQAEKRTWQTAVSMTVLSMSRKARSTLSGIGLQ